MEYEILHQDTFPVVQLKLEKGEKINCESDAMITKRGALSIKGDIKGGIIGGLARSFLTNESFFTQTIEADRGCGTVMIGSGLPGSIVPLNIVEGKSFIVEKGGFLACTQGVRLETKMQGIVKGLLSKEGFFLIRLSGSGLAFISSYGAAHKFELGPGEEMFVDNGHLLAWEENMSYRMEKASSGFVSSITSGEGMVCRFSGPGTFYIHTLKYYAGRR
jgi:uncharacterized protein (TIGR00266 family)